MPDRFTSNQNRQKYFRGKNLDQLLNSVDDVVVYSAEDQVLRNRVQDTNIRGNKNIIISSDGCQEEGNSVVLPAECQNLDINGENEAPITQGISLPVSQRTPLLVTPVVNGERSVLVNGKSCIESNRFSGQNNRKPLRDINSPDIVIGHRYSLTLTNMILMGRRDTLTMGKLDILTMGKIDILTMGKIDMRLNVEMRDILLIIKGINIMSNNYMVAPNNINC